MEKPEAGRPNPFAVLGVAPSATEREIERAYRRLCRVYHPDVSNLPEAGARMREINSAYALLKDPRRRAAVRARGDRVATAADWAAAHRVWRDATRPAGAPATEPLPRLRAMPATIDFGILRRGETAVRQVLLCSRDRQPIDARVLTRGDWLRVGRFDPSATSQLIEVTADPTELHAFWRASGSESARVDGWLDVVAPGGSLRIPAHVVVKREAPSQSWWRGFSQRAG